jgi:hypothetical protein
MNQSATSVPMNKAYVFFFPKRQAKLLEKSINEYDIL